MYFEKPTRFQGYMCLIREGQAQEECFVIYVKVCRADEGAMEGMTSPGCTE